ncbi:MAG: ribose transport system permease protein [Actinomycetota bacterium]|nr:transporter permease [Cryptosporangiaceae bacterium]MDQ1678434.1 ribose transport system permease protein [Actinomycetota bacterium]
MTLDMDTRSAESAGTAGTNSNPAKESGGARFVAGLLRVGLLPVLLVAGLAYFSLMSDNFFQERNATNIGRQLSFLLIVTMAQMLVLLTAEIDMSVGFTIALTSVVSSKMMVDHGVLVGILAGLAVGLVIGLINGVIVARFRVPSFIVTIGMGSIAFGLALQISSGSPISGLPESFTSALGNSNLGIVPVSLLIALGVFAVLYLVLNWTTLGRYFYAVGGGENAARLVGVPVFRTKVLAFVLCSVLTSLAGILLTARVSSGEPNLGGDLLIMSIAAAVLGGTSFFGGEGRLGLVAVGALFLVVLNNGMNLIRVSSYTQGIVLGVLLVTAVVIDRLRSGAGAR